jgi:hypothetical protein
VGRTLTEEEFSAQLSSVKRSALRLELQRWYLEPAEQPAVERFLEGSPQPPAELSIFADWVALVSRLTADGVTIARVRVQEEPPTPYQRWERWVGAWSVAAGEEISYLTRPRAEEVGLLADAGTDDWWLLDEDRLILMHFDREGRRVRTELTTDRDQLERAVRCWRLARSHASPLDRAAPASEVS